MILHQCLAIIVLIAVHRRCGLEVLQLTLLHCIRHRVHLRNEHNNSVLPRLLSFIGANLVQTHAFIQQDDHILLEVSDLL